MQQALSGGEVDGQTRLSTITAELTAEREMQAELHVSCSLPLVLQSPLSAVAYVSCDSMLVAGQLVCNIAAQ